MAYENVPADVVYDAGAHRSTALRNVLVDIGPRVAAAAGLSANWCIAAAGMTREFYADAGFEGVRVLGVQASAFNRAGWELWMKDVPRTEWPDEAWAVGTKGTGRVSENSWDGHAVAYVPAKAGDGQAWLLDLSASQMSRPARGINILPLALPVDGSFFEGDLWSWEMPGAMLTMAATPALTKEANRQVATGARYIKSLVRLAKTLIEVDFEEAVLVSATSVRV